MQYVRTHESRVSCHCFPSLFDGHDITEDVVLAQFAVRLAVRFQHIVQDLAPAAVAGHAGAFAQADYPYQQARALALAASLPPTPE